MPDICARCFNVIPDEGCCPCARREHRTYKVTTENAYGVDIFETDGDLESIIRTIRAADARMNEDERTIRITIEEIV